jgi:hypothetical protein
VLILDALDECGNADTREALLTVLAAQTSALPSAFRFIITSRPEPDISTALEDQPHIRFYELDISTDANSVDIASYFRERMAAVCTKKRYRDWPKDADIQALTEKACGLFVWASTASKFINAHDPRKRLDIILKGNATSGAENALDVLYQTALHSVDMWDDEDFIADFRAILGVVLILRNPLSTTAIDELLGSHQRRPSTELISQLGCVLSASPTVRLLHPSFADFLFTQQRCGRDIWYIDPVVNHGILAMHCLDLLDGFCSLMPNICHLKLDEEVDEQLPEGVTYACLHWVYHASMMTEAPSSTVDRLDRFLHLHLLDWFEVLSVLKHARHTTILLDVLRGWVTVSCLLSKLGVTYTQPPATEICSYK